ncbi:aspartate:alanine exchanger family transporter [Corynebacterium guangdongense]|uniref:Transport protein n=1 Tax=Corynebacterium guangdongense TaxID=1783348 RepID=A0ABU1ZXD7_9CORY|nr:aspartate:alanine exchanger family transporter [Corynebacterium guangdongense]MDR7328578.1 putative transport protein [Corynebacterium guangdongense]WJZ17155.1 Aspartate/alanine antiporter [Corynebacterium guangdongense]
MLAFLADNSLFTLVLILAVGLALGKVRIFGVSLGAAMVLFVALGLATANPEIQIPPLLYQLGLAMFVYAIGLSAGPAFFREFRTRGWKVTVLGLAALLLLTALAWVLVRAVGLDPVTGAGMFAGALSSTPGMAAVVSMVDPADAQAPVVGYSLAYPGAVIGTILVAAVGSAVLKVDHARAARDAGMVTEPLVWRGVIVGPGIHGRIGDLPGITGQAVIATRIADDPGHHLLADPTALLAEGMRLVINGTEEAVGTAIARLGRPYDAKIEDSELVYTRITVSSPEVAGRRIRELDTVGKGFLIARLRSGDSEVVPGPHTVLNYSDRVRVVASPSRLPAIRRFFGDSERALGDVDLLPFALGLALGLAIGLIPIPLPGGTVLTLGFGGGPIVAGLVLGALNRTGPVTWQLPFHANRTMQTLGLAVFLAGVGTSAGAGFRGALRDPSSLLYIGLGLVLTLASALLIGLFACQVLRMSWDEAMGMAAGMTTNPAVISYLNGQTGTELPNRGYATIYPTAMIGKIVAAQILLLLLV